MPDLTVVIVNYNTRDKLQDCLMSLLANKDDLSLEIIVVDNNSSDGSGAMVAEFAEVTLLQQTENTWFAGGNNIGVQQAHSDIVWLLNPDTVVPENSIRIQLDYLKNNPQVGAVTCKQVHPDGDILPICSRERQYIDMVLDYTFIGILFATWKQARHAENFYYGWQRDTLKTVEIAPGSSIMVYREDLLSFGVFDENLQLYFNDDDLCHNIRALGKEIHYLPSAWITHYEKSSVRTQSQLARQMYFADMLRYSQKHFGWVKTSLLKLLLIPTQVASYIKTQIKRN
ncbi:MAG: hypothetical protein Phog2KO_07010 [Phototrophicaceae bacterium]